VGGGAWDAGEPRDDEPGHHSGPRLDAQKKSLSATERDAAQRAAWRARTRSVDPARYVWVDETGSHRGLTPRFSRAPRGQRARGAALRNGGTNRTLVAALTLDGPGPGLLFDGAITGPGFAGYVRHVLAPTLRPGQIVVVDNLRAHHHQDARAAIEARGAELWFLPSYSPDLNPIEEGYSKLKAHLQRAEARTDETLSAAIWQGLATLTPQDIRGWYRHAGYPLTPHHRRDHLS
jgi:transposase